MNIQLCGLSEKHLLTLQQILSPYQTITQALIFGSRANGTFKPTSDVDIVLKGKITQKLIAKIKAAFEESNFPFFVDIIDYKDANKELKHHIDRQGIVFYPELKGHTKSA